jgi:hypothetical protein
MVNMLVYLLKATKTKTQYAKPKRWRTLWAKIAKNTVKVN